MRWMLLRVGMLVAGLYFLLVGVCHMSMRPRYEAVARVRVAMPGPNTISVSDPSFDYVGHAVQEEMRFMLSSESLRKVASRLHLDIGEDNWPANSLLTKMVGGPPNVSASH